MNPITEYQNYNNSSEPIKRLFAREWVFQLVKGGSLPSSHPISAMGFMYSTFGYTADQAYSIIRGVLDDCETSRKNLDYFDEKTAAKKKYLESMSPQNQAAPDNKELYEQAVDAALDLLKRGHDPKEVAELLSPEYFAIDGHPIKLSPQEVSNAMTDATTRFEQQKNQQQ